MTLPDPSAFLAKGVSAAVYDLIGARHLLPEQCQGDGAIAIAAWSAVALSVARPASLRSE